jgi:DNA-binding NtrC family response regulator
MGRRFLVGPCNILIVDDKEGDLDILERTFMRDYNVFSTTNGEDALSIMERNNIALVITEHCMPGMSGVDLLQKTLQKYPNTIRIILTEYTNERLLLDAINKGHVYNYVTKPCNPEEIKAIVGEGVAAYYRRRYGFKNVEQDDRREPANVGL